MEENFDLIVEKCRKGDRLAQTEIYRRYYRGMYSVSLRIVNNYAEAEDVMQEAFLSAFQQIKMYRGEVSFGSWLKRIVINRSIDNVRKRKIKFEDLAKVANRIEYDIDEAYFLSDITPEIIKSAISSLQDNYRIVLSLFLLEGYDHDEIAQILNITNSSSRVIYHRAKQQLKQQLHSKTKQFSVQ